MEFNLRLSSRETTRYPLPIDDTPDWVCVDDAWLLSITIPKIPKNHIIVPSYTMLDMDHSYQFSISKSGSPEVRSELMWVPPRPTATLLSSDQNFTAKIDCWHTTKSSTATIELRVEAATRPAADLLCISIRPLRMTPTGQQQKVAAPQPTPISQMMGPPSIAKGICSPTALAMTIDSCWPQTIRACYDPKTRAYGCWPLAINHAASQGILGAVEALSSWDQVVNILSHGRPIVCSINYSKNTLKDAPLTQTGGHLVVLYGIEDDHVLVMDPAAPDHASVKRRYNIDEFERAWLHERGAAYIFSNQICA